MLHLVVTKVKDTWRTGRVTSTLFLDIQAAFPNTVKEWLLHNIRSRHVPAQYIHLFNTMLTRCKTQLWFDDFLSNPIHIHNGTTQGCPLSMILYAYHNADLIDIARGKWELSTEFVDDCAFITIADTIDDAHTILKDMMERPNGGLEWPQNYNSPFKLSKLVVMDFSRTPWDVASSPLYIDKVNPDGTTTPHNIAAINEYKYLEVMFDPRLNWRAHVSRVVAKAATWTHQLWRLAKVTDRIPPGKAHQLYNMVAMPAFTYASDVGYISPFKLAHKRNLLGSVSVTKLL